MNHMTWRALLVRPCFETELAEACAPSHYNIGLLPWYGKTDDARHVM